MHITLDARYIDNSPGSTYGGGGVALYVEKLIEHLCALDDSMRLRLVARPGERIVEENERVEQVVFDVEPQSLRTLFALPARLRLDDTDLFHAPANVLPWGLPCPTVTTIHDVMWLVNPELCASFLPKRLITGAYYRMGIGRALRSDRILTVSEASRAAIAELIPERAEHIRVTHNALNPYFQTVERSAVDKLVSELGVDPEHRVVFVCGAGSPYKNQTRAVQAFVEAFSDDPRWRLVLVRRWSRFDRALGQLLERPEVKGQVISIQKKISSELLRALYNRADIFLFPSLCEGFGLPVLEAMACGAPVLTSTHPALVEVSGDAALHVDPRDVGAIARGLRRLAGDDVLRQGLITRGFERAQHFSWRDTAQKTLDTYREILDEKAPMRKRSSMHVARSIFRQILDEQGRTLTKLRRAPQPIVPWMKYREIEIVESVLRRLQPKRVLEWGSGYSSLYFSGLLDKDARWISIEHDEAWSEKVRAMNSDARVEVFTVPPNHTPWTDGNKDGSYSDMKDYVEFPSDKGPFDFILIDGRARKDCLIKAHTLLSPDGVVVLHDANRTFYHEPFDLFEHTLLLKDYRTHGGGIWLGSKTTPLQTFLDVEQQHQIWRVYRGNLGKALRL